MTDRIVGRVRNDDGISLVEVLVALTTFTFGLMVLGQLAFAAAKGIRLGRTQTVEWAAVQQKMDSVAALGWAALDGESGSETVNGQQITWLVTGTDPRVVTLSVPRGAVADTFVTYVAQ